MNKNKLKYLLFATLTSLFISSCRISKPYKTPEILSDNLYRDVKTVDTTNFANLPWKEVFTDTILQRLMLEGIQKNLDLKVAYTRIEQAQAYFRQSGAAFFPDINISANATRSKLSEAQGFGIRTRTSTYQVAAQSSWELDIWGKLSSSRRANLANLLQSRAGARAVQTSLVAGIANYYYTLLALDQQLAITQQTILNWDTTVRTMRALKEAARVTEAAVVQSEAQRYAAEVTIPDLKQQIRETENALSILLGMPPSSLRRGTLTNQKTVEVLKTGVPAQLLANRPDVQQAELNFRYFFELTNTARSYFYPSLTISASTGFSSLSLSDLFDSGSFIWNIGAGLTQPIFNRRANRTRLEVAKAQQQEAFLAFQNSLLFAGQEVSDALSLYQTASEKVKIRNNQMVSLERSVEYSLELLQNGFANYTEVITARQSLLQAELGQVDDRFQQLQAVVNLYRSLGGGWK